MNPKGAFMEKPSVIYFKRVKRVLLHVLELFIPSNVAKRNFVSWATFPRFNVKPDVTKYKKVINVAFCFNEPYIKFALIAISSLLENSPGCKYDIYCVSDITKKSQAKILKYVSEHYSNGKIIFLKPNKDYDHARSSWWPNAIWWRCMLPKLLPNTVDSIIYADVDTFFVRDLREANEFKMGTDLLAGCFDSPEYINSGFLVMNIAQMRKENTYPKMISWAENNDSGLPDQDMLNNVCCGRIRPMSRKFNVIVAAGYSFLKTMDAKLYRELRYPVMLHYAEHIKPWDPKIKRFLTFDMYRKIYNKVISNY